MGYYFNLVAYCSVDNEFAAIQVFGIFHARKRPQKLLYARHGQKGPLKIRVAQKQTSLKNVALLRMCFRSLEPIFTLHE